MGLPVITRDLAYKLDMLDAFYVEARMSGIIGKGIEINKYGNSLVLMAKEIPNEQFNSVRGFMIEDEFLLNEILEYYSKNQIKVRFDIVPSEFTPSISKKFQEHNLKQKSFHTVFYRDAKRIEDLNGDHIKVRKIANEEIEFFLDVYLKGFGVPDSWLGDAKEQRFFWTNVPEFHLYIATVNDIPIGASVLYIRDDIGYLAGASTLTEYRGMGCQNQQLIKRINDSADMGCRLVTSQAKFDSTSQRNMQRAGFQIAYTKGIWYKE